MDVELCCALKGRHQTARTQNRLESLRGLLYFCITSGLTVATNNLKGPTKPVALDGNVGKSQNGIIYHFYLFLATYCKKKMIQKKNWPGCKQK